MDMSKHQRQCTRERRGGERSAALRGMAFSPQERQSSSVSPPDLSLGLPDPFSRTSGSKFWTSVNDWPAAPGLCSFTSTSCRTTHQPLQSIHPPLHTPLNIHCRKMDARSTEVLRLSFQCPPYGLHLSGSRMSLFLVLGGFCVAGCQIPLRSRGFCVVFKTTM